ncbi:LysM peptidoglycan-binding domain-containing protein [Nesterenkonia flava]|uniref:LysM peptidoglycan-binding domain-containing protein n=1 Tax=Nesterenkonia flava TaxID=469799 RepID=A0ABU1FRU6_9MICC|nr:LysM peptidoglycan-binding domain-containing protein [Nesterenkonia flava]MDR5711384.1 LysM peptidoglycan-binding domain-containing protein [Nesterenkonia flava]
MVTILPRRTWTDQPKGFTRISNRRRTPANVRTVTPHYPAVGNVIIGAESQAQSCARLRGWRSMHIRVNGWADLGYDYAIDQAGRIYECSGHSHATAHALNNNFTAIGVLFIVGNNEAPSAAARAAFRALAAHLKRTAFPNLRTRPVDHGNMPGNATSCAGQPIRRVITAGQLDFGGTTPQASTGSSTARPGGTYTVRAGDTLGGIASAHGTTVSALASANGITNVDLIRVGQRLTIPGGTSGSSGGSSSGGSRPAGRSAETQWPGRPLDQIFTANRNPFRGKSGLPVNTWFDVVPASHSAAFFEWLRRAGFTPTSTSKWGHEELARQWLLRSHRAVTQRADVQRLGGGTFGNPRSIWAAVQVVLSQEPASRRYSGAIDGQPGAMTWWALTARLNVQRGAYNR